MRFLRILALVALCLAYAPTPALAVTGYDSAYSGESAFVTISPGQTLQFQVFFSNTGTLTWTKGGDTQVDLAACLADKVTCPAQDPSESTWNSGWLSTTRYATTTQATVAPGTLATFAYNIKAPSNAGAGVYRFNGDLVVSTSGARIHPEGYYQDAEIQATGNVPVPTPTPTPGSTPFPSAPPSQAPTPTPTPRLNFTISPWAYACGNTSFGNPVTATDTPDSNGCPEGDTGGTATAALASGALTITKTGATSDDLASGATINGIGHPTTASYDVAGYCGAGAPRINVVVDANANGVADGSDRFLFYGCNGHNTAGHVTVDFATDDNGQTLGASDSVVEIDFVMDETGSSTLTHIMFNGMSQ